MEEAMMVAELFGEQSDMSGVEEEDCQAIQLPPKRLLQTTLGQMFGVEIKTGDQKNPFNRKTPIGAREAAELRMQSALVLHEHSAELAVRQRLQRSNVGVYKNNRLKNASLCRSVDRNPNVKSNRLQPGMKRRRWDCNPHEGFTVCNKYAEILEKNGGHVADAMKTLKKIWDRPQASLKNIVLKGQAYWKGKMKTDMKTGAGSRGSLNKSGQNLKAVDRWAGDSKGCRAPGGGAKNRFAAHMKALEYWIDSELENQQAVEPEDTVEQFEYMLRGDALQLKQVLERTDGENARLQEVEHRLVKLQDANYRKWQKIIIMKTCRYQFLKPQRAVKLHWDEESRRLQRTWQSWDRVLWEVVQKDAKIIGEHAIDAARFMEQVNSGDLVLGFSDQVPWWGYVKTKKQLYPQTKT